ncbi:BTAD domain-containing putative transcriptional regulator [Nocardioides sp. STR2]|uniref:BTAD domain-containing putative transcriptional regulator n=1 Tax=Nocardioides pini TaxID=2975053 RepID=A0ABT4CD24_9ACTN|nr:BTAD domain-containing putative transcriptional regulator [Nocardioides pini]MCY4726844.1 BTAD domain-containing putative transcriptional regulator [Nocardioides pini]
MWVRVLGTSQVALGDEPAATVDVGARKPRSVLAALALRLGSDVPPDALVRLVWGEDAPRGAHGTLHSYLSGVRRVLEPGLGPREKPRVLLTSDHGYRLALDREHVDAHRFADEVRSLHRSLAPLAGQLSTGPRADWPSREEVSRSVDRIEELLALWTGDAYADLPDEPEVVLERTSLDQLRLDAEEARVLGLLALGDHAVVVAATEEATARYPLRERVWAMHALALTRSGRQAEALAALRQIRSVLADELGLDPGHELRELEQAVLVQDPALHRWLRASANGSAPAPAPAADTPAPSPAPGASTTGTTVGWPTVGREAEEAALLDVLARAEAGTPATALLVGEPGIGKSRLVSQVMAAARERGFRVATGRCSQDDGAPSLWPWGQALRELSDGDLDSRVAELLAGAPSGTDGNAEREAFLARERLAHEVTSRSSSGPVLLVLDDLHWADTASLKVLRHLVTSAAPGHRLAVVVTRRRLPEPTGDLAEVGEELARHHVTRLDLSGLTPQEARSLVDAVTGTVVPAEVLDDWHRRSGGNPYFLVELARLDARDSTTLPATVRDVIVRRLQDLPERTRELLLLAAVLGRRSSLDLVAAVAGEPAEDVDDALTPAREAGLVEDPEAGVVAFTHALTRDAVVTTASPSRLARLHAQVAHTLADDAAAGGTVGREERVAELARHWLAAGPTHVGRAWRAAADAAAQARRTFSWVEAEQLVAAAIDAHRRDPLGTTEERIDLLLTRAHDCRPNAEWDQVLPCAEEAIALARREGDLPRLAAAAAAASDGSVWMPQQWNDVPEDAVEDLRWAMAELPHGDSVERCRVMLALAVLLYYEPSARAEVRALAEEGVAMARRVGDPALLAWAAETAWKALWTPAHADARLELAREALRATREAADPDAEVVASVLLTGNLLELGDRPAYVDAAAATARLASRRRNSYAQVALGWIDLSLASLRRDEATVGRLAGELHALRPRLNAGNEALHLMGIHLMSHLWDERIGELIEPIATAMEVADNDMAADVLLLAIARVGDLGRLRAQLVTPIIHRVDNWSSATTWCAVAEAAAVAGDVPLSEQMAARLAPLRGRIAISGISTVMGPIDGYLALALAATGRRQEAAEAAARALHQGEEWGFTAYADWLVARREQLGF